jgi:phenylpyruvate tautomerase PptA (4-oxalocrotonate tautomerase family)
MAATAYGQDPATTRRSTRPCGSSVRTVPIVDVELVGDAAVTGVTTQRLADALGEALSSRAGGTWVRVRQLERSRYAENGGVDDEVHPVFVTVLERTRATGQDLVDRVARVTTAVADVIGRDPDHVHVLFEDDAAGRLSFGGRLVE